MNTVINLIYGSFNTLKVFMIIIIFSLILLLLNYLEKLPRTLGLIVCLKFIWVWTLLLILRDCTIFLRKLLCLTLEFLDSITSTPSGNAFSVYFNLLITSQENGPLLVRIWWLIIWELIWRKILLILNNVKKL